MNTQNEAMGKRCCGPPGMAGGDSARCLGALCMAWRAVVQRAETEGPSGEAAVPPAGDGWNDVKIPRPGGGPGTTVTVWHRPAGYCGLAGKPSEGSASAGA